MEVLVALPIDYPVFMVSGCDAELTDPNLNLFLRRGGSHKNEESPPVEKGFGFITSDDGSMDIFVHRSTAEAEGYRTLQENQAVEYEPA